MNTSTFPAIECKGLVKTYRGRPPVQAVRGIDLTVWSGECFGVLGPNGAGKTTTIEILEGLLTPTAGAVEILGQPWSSDSQRIRQQIGVSLQETQLSERLTVRETLSLFRSFYRNGPTVDEVIRRVDLGDKAKAWVKKLSGGQKQRLAVACALVGDPQLVFLDEPTTGLDPTSRRQLWDIIRKFREEGRTILLTTHYMEEAERLCDRVAIFDQGRIIAQGTPTELIESLGADQIVEFSLAGADNQPVDIEPAVFGELVGVSRVDTEDGTLRLTVNDPSGVLAELVHLLADRRARLASLTTRRASLDDVFVHLTGRRIDQSDDKAAA